MPRHENSNLSSCFHAWRPANYIQQTLQGKVFFLPDLSTDSYAASMKTAPPPTPSLKIRRGLHPWFHGVAFETLQAARNIHDYDTVVL